MTNYNFDVCKANCKECNSIDVTPVGEENLYFCNNTNKILEEVDDTTLKELGM